MADVNVNRTLEIGPNARAILIALTVILGTLVNAWIGDDAKQEAEKARKQGEISAARIKAVGRDVREVQNDRRVMMGKAPLPPEPVEPDQ